jgi:hypothetical protein
MPPAVINPDSLGRLFNSRQVTVRMESNIINMNTQISWSNWWRLRLRQSPNLEDAVRCGLEILEDVESHDETTTNVRDDERQMFFEIAEGGT